jgi:hypothetical protein
MSKEKAMNACQRWQRFALTALILSVLCRPAAAFSSASAEAGGQPGKYPLHVLILRHAEKPDQDNDPHLTSRGAARAAALPSLFLIPPTFPTKPAPLPTPDFIFATQESKHSNRPVETVTPLAKALGDMPIHAKHKDEDYQAVVDEIFGKAKYAGKTTLICWHHGKIPHLTLAILEKAKNGNKLKDQVPKHWDDAIFDRVWQITLDDAGTAAFADQPQRLLFGDHAKSSLLWKEVESRAAAHSLSKGYISRIIDWRKAHGEL